jgi:hypothetical protein
MSTISSLLTSYWIFKVKKYIINDYNDKENIKKIQK